MAAGQQTFSSLPIGVFLETLQETFINATKRAPDQIGKLFKVKNTNRYRNTYQGFSGLSDFNTWDMESAITAESINPRYETTVTQAGWRKAIQYTYKTKKYEKYDLMTEMADQLGYVAATTKQRKAFNWLNAQLAGTDGVYWNTTAAKYLFSVTHALESGANAWINPVTGSSTSYGINLLTGALSPATLKNAIALLYMTPDDMGNPMCLQPAQLWVAPATESTAHEVLKSRQKSGTANNDTNFIYDKYGSVEIVVCPWITDSDSWFLASTEHKLVCEVSIGLEQRMYEEDSTRNTVHDACFAFQVGAKDWRGIVASQGA